MTDVAGDATINEFSTTSFTCTNVSDAITGDQTINEYDLTTYSLQETSDTTLGPWTLAEQGTEIIGSSELGNSVQGGYNQTEAVTDAYTLIETGTVPVHADFKVNGNAPARSPRQQRHAPRASACPCCLAHCRARRRASSTAPAAPLAQLLCWSKPPSICPIR